MYILEMVLSFAYFYASKIWLHLWTAIGLVPIASLACPCRSLRPDGGWRPWPDSPRTRWLAWPASQGQQHAHLLICGHSLCSPRADDRGDFVLGFRYADLIHGTFTGTADGQRTDFLEIRTSVTSDRHQCVAGPRTRQHPSGAATLLINGVPSEPFATLLKPTELRSQFRVKPIAIRLRWKIDMFKSHRVESRRMIEAYVVVGS